MFKFLRVCVVKGVLQIQPELKLAVLSVGTWGWGVSDQHFGVASRLYSSYSAVCYVSVTAPHNDKSAIRTQQIRFENVYGRQNLFSWCFSNSYQFCNSIY